MTDTSWLKAFWSASQALIERVWPTLVVIRGRRFGAGAGIVYRADGVILTNNHVAGRRTLVVSLHDGQEFEARILARDPGTDLALLKIEVDDLPSLPLTETQPRVGEMVLAFGHPWGQRDSLTGGIVSALTTAQTRDGRQIPILRTDVPLAPGNSGGPMINGSGEVIGLNTMIVGGDQSISIPAEVIRTFVGKVLATPESQVGTQRATPEILI